MIFVVIRQYNQLDLEGAELLEWKCLTYIIVKIWKIWSFDDEIDTKPYFDNPILDKLVG